MVAAIEQVGLLLTARHQVGDPLGQRPGRRALEHRAHHLVRDVAHHPHGVHAAELITEIGQQALRDELQ